MVNQIFGDGFVGGDLPSGNLDDEGASVVKWVAICGGGLTACCIAYGCLVRAIAYFEQQRQEASHRRVVAVDEEGDMAMAPMLQQFVAPPPVQPQVNGDGDGGGNGDEDGGMGRDDEENVEGEGVRREEEEGENGDEEGETEGDDGVIGAVGEEEEHAV